MGCLKLHHYHCVRALDENASNRLRVLGKNDATAQNRINYSPYGKILREYVSSSGREKYLTTHHERDKETALDYRGARFYDSDVGRFLSLDPLAVDYPTLSDYCYVAGNPIIYVDPDGKKIVFPSLLTQFGKDFQRDLNILYRGKYGRALIRDVHSSSTLVNIEDAGSMFTDDRGDVLNSGTRGDGPSGTDARYGNIDLQYAQREGVTVGGTNAYSFLVLAHEMVHARDIANDFFRKLNQRVIDGEVTLPQMDVPNEIGEIRAMIYTNMIRNEHGLGEVRTTYKNAKGEDVKLLQDDGVTPIKDYGFDVTEGLFEEETSGNE